MEIIEMTEVVEVDTRLDVIVSQAGLGQTDVVEFNNSYSPFISELAQIKVEAGKINWDNPTLLDEKIAKNLRLRTVKVRTGSDEAKDNRKRIHMLRANVEQQAFNLIKADCQLEEEKFTQVEKRREIQERKRIEALRDDRIEIINPYSGFIPVGLSLGEMSEDDFEKLLTGAKLQYEAKMESVRKAEEDRIEKERQEAVEKERIRLENVKLRQEAEEREAEIKAERAKADAERKEAELKAAKEKAAVEAKLKEEREAREKIEAEAMAKLMAENKAKKDAEALAEKEAKEKARADKKAAAAPDKEKLLQYIGSLVVPGPELKTKEANDILSEYLTSVELAKSILLSKINEL